MSNIVKKLKKAAEKLSKEHGSEFNYRTAFSTFKVRTETFESSNFYFNPKELYATSYRWWPMLKVIKGKLILNSCNYSNSTAKHQRKLWKAMHALNIKADIEVSTKADISNTLAWRESMLHELADRIEDNRRSRKPAKNFEKHVLKTFNKLVKAKIFKKLTNKELSTKVAEAKERRDRKNAWIRERKEIRKQRAEAKTQMITTEQAQPSAQLYLVKE